VRLNEYSFADDQPGSEERKTSYAVPRSIASGCAMNLPDHTNSGLVRTAEELLEISWQFFLAATLFLAHKPKSFTCSSVS